MSTIQSPFANPSYHVRRARNPRGKGKGKYRLFTDADLSTPIEEIEPMVAYLEDGYDICSDFNGIHHNIQSV